MARTGRRRRTAWFLVWGAVACGPGQGASTPDTQTGRPDEQATGIDGAARDAAEGSSDPRDAGEDHDAGGPRAFRDAGGRLDGGARADVGLAGQPDASTTAADAGVASTPRPTGTLTLTPSTCRGRVDVCYDVNITCSDIASLSGSLAITEPSSAPTGTVILHKGGGGTSFLDMGFVDALASAGYRVVQIRYASDWEQEANRGMVAAGCRPATVFRVVAQMFSGAPTCLVGFSGGSGAIGFAMAHYGLENDVAYALLAAGPPFGRIDYGCAPTQYMGPPRSLCPALPNAPYAYSRGPRLDAWMGTMSCGQSTPTAAEVAMWRESSIVSSGADYDYGAVRMDWFFCASNPNETTGLADFYIDRITSATSVSCYAASCTGEQVFNNPVAFEDAVRAITTHCR